MKRAIHFTLLVVFFSTGTSPLLMAQKLMGKTEFVYFFDNTEFAHSSYAIDQTMSGIQLTPQVGIQIDKRQQLLGGISLLKKMGTPPDKIGIDLVGYYQYDSNHTIFKAGIFPKESIVGGYDDLFFQDSIHFYRPLLQGLYWRQMGKKWHFATWIDWTGMQTDSVRESFYLGSDGERRWGKRWYIDYQLVLFHLANNKRLDYGVVDYATALLSVGYRYAPHSRLGVQLSAGLLTGYENDRRIAQHYTPTGMLVKAEVRYKNMGVKNLLYTGEQRMNFYNNYGHQLYWGNPFYQSKIYFQNNIFWRFLDTKWVKGEIASKLHLLKKSVFFEQRLTLKANIYIEKKRKKNRYNTIF